MPILDQNECETHRVITLGRCGPEVLVVRDGGRFRLPSVVIPRWERVAENLTTAMKNEWGEDVICLFTPDCASETEQEKGFRYEVTEHWHHCGEARTPTQWMPVSALSQESFRDPSDHSAIQYSLAECRGETPEPQAGPFARPGWFKELCEWTEAVIGPRGIHLKGGFRQFNASPTFSLIRFETDGPALWFKAVGEPNRREFPITCTLGELFPNHVPPILATRPDWNGWLAQEVEGSNLGGTQEFAAWEAAIPALAKLQIASMGHHSRLLEAGARDLSVASLSDRIQPFIEIMAQLMARQSKVPPPILDPKDLLLLGERIQDAVHALAALGIPEALGHLDLNPGNIIVSRDVSSTRCAFLDWAEAYVGNPFSSFEYLRQHLHRTIGTDSAIERRLNKSYAATWEPILSSAAIAEASALAPLLAVFAYAAGSDAWQDRERLEEPATAGYLRGLTRRMNREATELAERRLLCLR